MKLPMYPLLLLTYMQINKMIARRTDHPPELRDANRSAISNLLSNTTATATHVLNVPGTKCTIELTTDSITMVKADAIVNAADEMLEGGVVSSSHSCCCRA